MIETEQAVDANEHKANRPHVQVEGRVIMSQAYRMINKNHPHPDSIKKHQVGKREHSYPKVAQLKHSADYTIITPPWSVARFARSPLFAVRLLIVVGISQIFLGLIDADPLVAGYILVDLAGGFDMSRLAALNHIDECLDDFRPFLGG